MQNLSDGLEDLGYDLVGLEAITYNVIDPDSKADCGPKSCDGGCSGGCHTCKPGCSSGGK